MRDKTRPGSPPRKLMKKRKRGQPTKYKPEYCQHIISFFDIAPHFEKDITITKSDGTQIDKTEQTACDLPFFSDWCHKIGITQETMCQWVKKFTDFSEAYKRAQELQKQILITNGLLGLYASAAFIFTMKNICGWRDEKYLEHSGEIKGGEAKIIFVTPSERKADPRGVKSLMI